MFLFPPTQFLLFSLLNVFYSPSPPPPHFYCFPFSSSSFLLFSLLLLHLLILIVSLLLLLISIVFPPPPPPPHFDCFPFEYIDLTSFLLTLVVACFSSVLFLTLFSISWFSISLQSFSPLFSLTFWSSDALLLLSGDRSTVLGLKKFFIVTGGVVALVNVLWLMSVSGSSYARLASDGCLEGSVELKTPFCLS